MKGPISSRRTLQVVRESSRAARRRLSVAVKGFNPRCLRRKQKPREWPA